MIKVASKLRLNGWILRSGGADGADAAFEVGAGKESQIFLPWKGFNGSDSKFHQITNILIGFSLAYHPNGNSLSDPVKRLMARNAQQILGENLDCPSKFVICWTPKNNEGGTGQALRIARDHNIPIFNLREKDVWERVVKYVLG